MMTSRVELVILVVGFVTACSSDDPNLGRTNDAGVTSAAGASGAPIGGPGAGGAAGTPSSAGGRGQSGTAGSGGGSNTRGGGGGVGGVGGRAASGGITSTGGNRVTGGTGGGTAGTSGSIGDAGPESGTFPACHPDPHLMCDTCVQTKCCLEWLDCANDEDCLRTVGGKQGEFPCIESCLVLDDAFTLEECAGMCQHGVTVSLATSELIACMRAGSDSMQNCTMECFGRLLP